MAIISAGTSIISGGNFDIDVGGGKVNQIVQSTVTGVQSTSGTSNSDISGMSVTITPSATSSKILVLAYFGFGASGQADLLIRLLRNGTTIQQGDASGSRPRSAFNVRVNGFSIESRGFSYLDSPSTTSATTYKFQWQPSGNGSFYLNREGGDYYRTASAIQALEVLA
jgi:hypothetical protein